MSWQVYLSGEIHTDWRTALAVAREPEQVVDTLRYALVGCSRAGRSAAARGLTGFKRFLPGGV